jgi:hypothetical protein
MPQGSFSFRVTGWGPQRGACDLGGSGTDFASVARCPTMPAMGMHHGLVAVTAGMDQLLAELERSGGEFVRGAPIAAPYRQDGLAVGELDGRAYLFDPSFLVSDHPDAWIAMSERLGTVVAGGAETVSGTWWLTVARDGELLRFVFVSHAAMTHGMAVGEPLPTEDTHPIEDLDGAGLFAVLDLYGFAAPRWLEEGPAFALDCRNWEPVDGWVSQTRDEHMARYAHPPDHNWLDDLVVVVRDDRGQVIEARPVRRGRRRRWWWPRRRTL